LREQVHEVEKIDFIERHQQTLALSHELNEIFRPIIFIEFLAVSFVLGGIGVTFAMSRNFIEHLMLLIYGSVMMVQLFIYCYGGQYLKERALSVCDEVYKLDRDYKLIIMRIQKGVKIEAPFFRATMEQFASVMNTTWALISIIRSSMK
jgi:sensor histidine kinase YesM